jgi:UDP-2,3-diacylglucosamine pyrophosphatase LpxH
MSERRPGDGSAFAVRRKRTLIVSDVHLSQTHPDDPTDPMWMRYRRSDLHPDAEFAALVDHALDIFSGDAIELCFNGDVLDFDAPWVKDGTSSFDEFPLDDAGCAAQAERILSDHPGWFGAVARVLLAGHRVLFLSGNHDVELYWPGARTAIRAHLVKLCRAHATSNSRTTPDEIAASIESRVRFRAWFHVTEDGIYLEHGSQYDVFNGVPWPMLPVRKEKDWIHPVMGKLAFKRTGSRMGYFNPYYEETFYMGLTGYLGHFISRYLLSRRRHIVRTWFWGGISTVLEVFRGRHRQDWTSENRARAVEEIGASKAAIDATQALRADLAERTMLPILRELWLDRVTLAFAVALAIGFASLFGTRPALVVAAIAIALFVGYEVKTPKPDIRTYDSTTDRARELYEVHHVRAICLGHTHRPYGIWDERGRFWGNSGSWCPAFRDAECTEKVLAERPVLILTSEGDELEGGLFGWANGRLEAQGKATLPLDEARELPKRAALTEIAEPRAAADC